MVITGEGKKFMLFFKKQLESSVHQSNGDSGIWNISFLGSTH